MCAFCSLPPHFCVWPPFPENTWPNARLLWAEPSQHTAPQLMLMAAPGFNLSLSTGCDGNGAVRVSPGFVPPRDAPLLTLMEKRSLQAVEDLTR